MTSNADLNAAYHEAKDAVFDGKTPCQAVINEAHSDDGMLCYVIVARGPKGAAIAATVHELMDGWDGGIKEASG